MDAFRCSESVWIKCCWMLRRSRTSSCDKSFYLTFLFSYYCLHKTYFTTSFARCWQWYHWLMFLLMSSLLELSAAEKTLVLDLRCQILRIQTYIKQKGRHFCVCLVMPYLLLLCSVQMVIDTTSSFPGRWFSIAQIEKLCTRILSNLYQMTKGVFRCKKF
jgi:hypothetical protein